MAITVVGNHSRGFKGHGVNGNGASANVPVGMGWTSVIASAANDVAFIQLSSIVMSEINQGVFFQSEVAVTVDFTLCNPALAEDPNMQENVMWGNHLALTAGGDIKAAPVAIFTTAKITFSAPGALYIAAR